MGTKKLALGTPINPRILDVRGQRVMVDADLAEIYGVDTKRLNEAVKRNSGKFPPDFMFVLTDQKFTALRSQFATSNTGRGGRRYPPRAFTEHGALMAATVLNSPRAVEVSIYVVRMFVRTREAIAANKELTKKLNALERRVDNQDETIVEIVQSIRQLMAAPPQSPPENKPKRKIGFV